MRLITLHRKKRKYFLLILMMIVAGMTKTIAQSRLLLLEESFDGDTMPTGWTISSNNSNWSVSATNNAGGTANEMKLDWSPQFNGMTRLVSPVIDLTGINSVVFSFKHALDNYSGSNSIGVATTSDGGITWNQAWTKGYGTSGSWLVCEQISTPDMGQTNVQFCIFFNGNSYNINDWYFDDIIIFTLENLDLSIESATLHNFIGSGETSFGIKVYNYGVTTVTSVKATYEVEGMMPVTETFQVNIPALDIGILNFTNTTVLSPGLYDVVYSIDLVNGQTDDVAENNILEKSVSVAIGSAERIPMIEHFSSSTCGPCVSVNTAMLNFCNNNPGRFTYTKYQMNWPGNGDPYYTEEGGVRRYYYGCNAIPQCFLDGEDQGYAAITQGTFDQHAERTAFMDIRGSFSVSGTTITVKADVMPYIDADARIFVSVNEKETHNNVGSNGETSFHHVFMKMLPDAEGTSVNMTACELQHLEFTQDMSGTHVEEMSDLEVSIWVQNYNTMEMFNSRFAYEYTNVHPYPVQNLSLVEDANGNMIATWSALSQATGYRVYVNGEMVMENTTSLSYIFPGGTTEYNVVGVQALYGDNMTSVITFDSHLTNPGTTSYLIRAFANPESGGVVTGEGIYNNFETCTLTATASEGYTFTNWTKNGEIVSTNSTFSFTVTENATYVANFLWTGPSSSEYISDGLIMYLDGINNTRNGHSTTTDVWEDLMGNYDLTVNNYASYAWEDNHFIGLGDGGFLNTGKTWQYFHSLNDDITIEIVTYIDCDKTSPSYRGLAGWHVGSDGTHFQNDQGSGRMQTLGLLPVTEADDQIATVSYTRNNGSFLNGIWKTNSSHLHLGFNSGYTAVFGNSHAQCRGWNDSIYCIRMYNRTLTPEEIAHNHNVDRERFIVDPSNASYITVSSNPTEGGTISGAGLYENGQTCTLSATPAQGYFFLNWTKNDYVVSTNPTYSFTVTGNATYTANFVLGLPELHITNLSHSTLIGGQQATISWTVKNNGSAATPNGATWHDHVWLSVESSVDVNSNNPILLGTFDNLSALNVGEYYMQTKTVNIPLEISGDYYLFVTTDAYDAYQINWDNNVVPIPYNPPPYISCLSHGGNVIYEQSECEQGYSPGSGYNDNFFYELVNIEVPILPDLQVTSVVPQTNFFSGSMVNVTATVSNLGENFTLTDHWVDALYIASEPDFNSSTTICLAVKQHSGTLGVGQSYQVHFSGRVPLTMYGEAYFFVYTDCYEQVYEHVLNHNNIMMSDAVNVILSPPADLVSADLTFPTSVSTGETFAYSYKVYNNGAGDPNVNNWVDKIYLCQNADTLDANAVLLKTINHYGGLHHGANYSISESMVLPSEITSGSYYLYVHADADNDVFEYLYDGNNLALSNAIYVTRPDLQVTQISVPEQITGGYPLNLSYTLTNVGEGIVRNRMVTDRVYFSASGNINDTIRVANIKRNVYLPSGQNLTVMCNDLAPYSLTDGTYHLLVLTDCDNEINESNEGNNMLTHYPMSVLHQPLPDLQPVSLSLPAVIQAGEAVAVEFDITNIGDLDLLNSNCTFDIYATWSDKEILCPVQSQTQPLGNNVSIGIGQTVHFVRSVLVPPTVTSACSTFELIANKGRLVPELDTTNNVYTATVSVLDCPLPDLVVTNISANAMQSGVENQISFTVKNVGTADFEGGFNTTVYVRSITDTILCPLVLQVSPSTNNYTIPIGGTLSFTQKVLVPPMANASCNLLEIYVDEENQVLEANDDNNATTIVSTVINYPFDLKTTALQVPDSVWAGETTSLSWTVKNIGTCPSQSIPFYLMVDSTYFLVQGEILPQPWMDKVYVSEDEVLSDDDIEVCSVARSTVLQPDGTYTVVQSVTLPYSNLGSQFLLCVSDATHVTYDSDTLNNVKAIPVEVQLGSLPDLRNTSLIVEETMNYDRAYWVRYTVVNEGERVTQKETWTDAFYLGETMTTDEAFQLGSKIHHGALAVGETYTDSIEIILPNSLEGSYYLIGLTDATHQIYEHDNEDDNLLAVPVMVLPPNPSDLIAVQPDFPATVASGANMTVSWQLQNIGFNSAVGRVRNAVYLSTDAAWSSDDVMLDYVDIDINIAANAQQECSLSGMLTSVPEGNYFVIVKVNILNALNESSYENNVCVSLMTTEVGYPTLAIGEQVDRSLAADQYIYYKLEVGPEYEGQTLSCTLTSANQQVANGLYLSHEAVPTLAQYDYGQYAPYTQEIEVLIPVLEQGVYYLLAKGSTQNGNPQQVSIATSIINFEILHIDADHGSNTGSITTKVIGAKFDSIMDFRLVQGGDYLPAEKVFFSNSTEAYTTFDLVDMPAGTYAMEAELPGGIITIKGNAFVIEEGLPAELAVNVVAPASVRFGTIFTVNIEYGNIGTTDLNVSGLVVMSHNGHPIGFTTEALEEGHTELTFDTGEANGNPDVLRPGYRGTKTILVKATPLSDYRLSVYAIRRQY